MDCFFCILYTSTIYRLQGKLLLMPLYWLSKHPSFLLGLSLFAYTLSTSSTSSSAHCLLICTLFNCYSFFLSSTLQYVLANSSELTANKDYCQRQFNMCFGHQKTYDWFVKMSQLSQTERQQLASHWFTMFRYFNFNCWRSQVVKRKKKKKS